MIDAGDLLTVRPLIILAGSILAILVAIVIRRSHILTLVLTVLALAMSAITSMYMPSGNEPGNVLFTLDGFGQLFMVMLFLAALVITVIAYGYLKNREENREEFYVLLLTGALGSAVLAIASHFISFFLGLELLSVSIYILSGYERKSEKGMEAAVKYLILAGVSSAFLVMGMALLYGQTGALEFKALAEKLSETGMGHPMALTGLALVIVGTGFKMAVVPFHLWTPDVYQGAPTPATAFIASVSKGSIVALLVRLFMTWEGFYFRSLFLSFSLIAILSMLLGNLLALRQRNVKRLLAYSSIAHLGYVLVAFLAAGDRGTEAVSFYLIAYFISIIGSFGIVALVTEGGEETYSLESFKGLFWQKPWIAFIFTTMLLSLAGIPITAGFIGKLYVLSAGVNNSLWALSLALVIGSVLGLYYYLKIIVEMFKQVSGTSLKLTFSLSTIVILTLLTALVIWLGVNPGSLSEVVRRAVLESFIGL